MRAIAALLVAAIFVAAATFFADRPGRVEIVWQEWQIDTSVAVVLVLLLLAALLLVLVFGLVSALVRLPRRIRRRRRERERRLGEAALTRGLVAMAAGSPAEAQVQAYRAERLLDRSPMALLLAAEAAERQGDKAAARRYFADLSEQPEAEFIGLRGLLAQTLREGETDTALRLAERAQRLRPDVPWVTGTLLGLQASAGQWEAARDTLAAARRRGVIPRERARHHGGVVLHELSRAAEQRGDLRQAAALAARAQARAPDLAAIACHHARLLTALGRSRAAAKVIERAWQSAPHPDLARAYLEAHPEAGPIERAAALQRLASQNPEAAESHLALAEAALAARLTGEARRHLTIAAENAEPPAPSRRLSLMMARLEDSEADGAARARRWLDLAVGAPPDPCYVCALCNAESGDWRSLCPRCGGFDTLSWRVPERTDRADGPAAAISVFPPMLPAQKRR
jgi:HemY protein